MTDKSNDDNDKPRSYGTLTPIGGGRQTEIPGTQRTVTAIEEAAEALRLAADAAKEAGQVKKEREEDLVAAMQRADVHDYKYTDSDGRRWRVTATSITKVKLKRGAGE